ncbi:TPA: hypothetical protein N2685_004770 [Vibrio parahaemolyticus]|uniref:hypothetical protein n=1 Tax=Vibrio parahaemolyticus TaxID=670 RepID=UPI00387B3FA2|nr:hypothetical protein [Vibrio parahaemolyticus]MBE5136897.1 trypsin-like peptidase domain-containing protein [Vibrio parahaemolyticus]HCE2380155.1 hypothetical protein [Vibrio parahaemolyticus]HCG8728737.1 hypothetical protein [Vibrio parahaemolyticus]HCH1697061.1 hypothetical protein [Vibrio parahaemolyticus]
MNVIEKFVDRLFGISEKNREADLQAKFLGIEMLKHKSVKIDIVTKGNESYPATGFLVKDNSKVFLYTCWHVVGASGLYELRYNSKAELRTSLKVTCSGINLNRHSVLLDGKYIFDVPLYNGDTPLWRQDIAAQDNMNFWGKNFKAPLLHDCISFDVSELIDEKNINPYVFIDKSDFYPATFVNFKVGMDTHIVGYPFGYSANDVNPVPVVLKRSIAAKEAEGAPLDFLLDGDCAPGMSGSPIFIITDDKPRLVGIYTGCRFTFRPGKVDQMVETRQHDTSLGVGCLLSQHFMQPRFYGHVKYDDLILKEKDDWLEIYSTLNRVDSEAIELRNQTFPEIQGT